MNCEDVKTFCVFFRRSTPVSRSGVGGLKSRDVPDVEASSSEVFDFSSSLLLLRLRNFRKPFFFFDDILRLVVEMLELVNLVFSLSQ